MITQLVLVILLLITVICGLLIYQIFDKKKYQSRIQILEDFIEQLNLKQEVQNNQLQLSEELKQKLAYINATLNKDIYEVNFNLVEKLYPRK